MRRYQDDEGEDDLFDERGVMTRDGALRVPAMLMDSEPRSFAIDVSAYAAMSVFGDRSPLIGDAAQRRLDDSYAAAEHALTNAWRNPPPAPAETRRDPLPSRATVDGKPLDADVDLEAAHAAHDAWLQNAWRSR